MTSVIRKITSIVGLPVILLGAQCVAAQGVGESDEVTAAIEAAKKAPRNQGLNLAAGNALKNAGRFAESIPYFMKGGNAGNLGAAEAAYYLYDFDAARTYLDKYTDKRTAAQEERDTNYSYGLNTEPIDWAEYLSDRIDLGRSMLDRVEKIQIIDSVNVPAEEFFDFIRIARSAGSLQGEDVVERVITDADLARLGLSDIVAPAYVTESGDDMIWTGGDAEGATVMFESSRLSDGTWDTPQRLFDYSSVFGNSNGTGVAYPFLMADGVTLYFAADGEESLGNLDIFISRRDENGFLQPSNIGMPYNSPYNDYLYAIDEQNGVGWWVTDRNGIPDKVTVYTFLPQELRNNYASDSPRLADYAKVTSIADTWAPGADYTDIRRRIQYVAESRRQSVANDFDFALPDGRVMHRLSDFRSAMARSAMQDYLRERKAVEAAAAELEAMRRRYAAGDRSVSGDILNAERRLEADRRTLVELSNQVVSMEM
ncbi:MAG: hypothetical protein HDS01_09280 [Bacteroides sp.]|nr:hypothetical protein [Bacteroides sp.]